MSHTVSPPIDDFSVPMEEAPSPDPLEPRDRQAMSPIPIDLELDDPGLSGDYNASKYCTELVIVCCHAHFTYNGLDRRDAPVHENNWRLKPFQQTDRQTGKPGEHSTFVSHIRAGAELLRRREALLMFSGGATDSGVANLSESRSYYDAYVQLYGPQDDYPPLLPEMMQIMWGERVDCELDATDSYQNLLFSIVRFRKITGIYPHMITVVTHAFKASRFTSLHGPAIRWPAHRLRVLGINPPFTGAELAEVERQEQTNAFEPFQQDPYGVRPPLYDKRLQRRWHGLTLDFIADGMEEKIQELIHWRGGRDGKQIFPHELPWETIAWGGNPIDERSRVGLQTLEGFVGQSDSHIGDRNGHTGGHNGHSGGRNGHTGGRNGHAEGRNGHAEGANGHAAGGDAGNGADAMDFA